MKKALVVQSPECSGLLAIPKRISLHSFLKSCVRLKTSTEIVTEFSRGLAAVIPNLLPMKQISAKNIDF
jgi:hypothetical protein